MNLRRLRRMVDDALAACLGNDEKCSDECGCNFYDYRDDPCLNPGSHSKQGCERCSAFIARCRDALADERLRDMVLHRATPEAIEREFAGIFTASGMSTR